MAGPRVLTFNFHEPYLCLMARTGYPITVGHYESGDLHRVWQTSFRPIPPNIHIAREAEWRHDLQHNKFDVIVAHNETNAASVFKSSPPALLVCHNRRSFIRSNFPPDLPGELRAFDRLVDRLQERFKFIFISESKRDDYGVPGRVILPGIDVEEYGGYTGERAEVLRVGNSMRERNRMFDVDFQEDVVAALPNRVLGVNALIPGSEPAKSFDDLLWHYRHLRALLHVTREDYEDGYNLAMLEAMACGMPVVALANESSPLIHHVDGFVASDARELRESLRALLDDLDLARHIGARGRETAAATFPLDRFVRAWQEALEEAAESRGIQPRWHKRMPPEPRLVLLQYAAGPCSMARLLEWELRRNHEVVTLGPRPAQPGPRFPSQQIDTDSDDVEQELRTLYADNRGPELHIAIQETPDDPLQMPAAAAALPSVCWVMHDAPDTAGLTKLGFTRVVQLPPACSLDLTEGLAPEKDLDVLIVAPDPARRAQLMELLESMGSVGVNESPSLYAQASQMLRARIVVCAHPAAALHPAVQAMACGALVLAEGSSANPWDLEDGVHWVRWQTEDELAVEVKRSLIDADSRVRIAGAGQRHVLANHTFERRMEQLMSALAEPIEREITDQRLEVGGYYRSPRPEFAIHVPHGTRRVLDVGCGAGEFGRALKAERGVGEVIGIEIVESAWHIARAVLDQAILGNIEEMTLPFPDGHFDCITCGDVLEHLVNPLATLNKLKRVLAPGGVIVASIPNARFYQVVEMLGNGRWMYQDAGIMDRTHLRFFTAVEMLELFREAGLRVSTLAPLSMMNESALPISGDGYIQLQKMRIGPLTESEYRDFLVYQYLVIAEHRSGDLLHKAQMFLDAKENEKAYQAAQLALDEGEDRASGLRVLAKAGARIGKVAEAEQWYRESLSLREDPEVRGEYGLVLFALGRCADARTQLDAAHKALPDHGRVLSGLGLCDLAEGRAEDAFTHFKASLDADFDNEAAVEHLVGIAQQLGRLADAEPYVRRFVDFYPGNLDMGCVYAAVLIELGRHDQARARLDNVLLLDPTHENARSLLGQIESRG